METHRGHSIKPLKTIFEEARASATEAQDQLKKYSAKLDDSEYSLEVIKIIKSDTTDNAMFSILSKIKKFLEEWSQRIKESFLFLDKKKLECMKEKTVITEYQKELNDALKLDMKFDSVDELYSISQKITSLISNQKYNEITEMTETNRFKTISIEHDSIVIDVDIPNIVINKKEEYSIVVKHQHHQFLLKVCPKFNFRDVYIVYIEDLDDSKSNFEYICKLKTDNYSWMSFKTVDIVKINGMTKIGEIHISESGFMFASSRNQKSDTLPKITIILEQTNNNLEQTELSKCLLSFNITKI